VLHWEHPRLGSICPRELLQIAEESGSILEIADWTFRQVVRQLADWQRTGDDDGSIPAIGINLTRRHLLMPGLADDLAACARSAGVCPSRLVLEIAESALTSHREKASQITTALRAEGFRIAVDDFGTGQSSLSLLHELPFDAIKIHQSQIDGPGGAVRAAVIRAIAAEARGLQFHVLSAGLDSPEQAEEARWLGCEYGQGHIIAPPLPPDELALFAFARRTAPTRNGSLRSDLCLTHASFEPAG
jgi:EAL domain-containing protein (putative c-di-GMP-specific phosphodiesterase class I)